jgi:hypothetical protein
MRHNLTSRRIDMSKNFAGKTLACVLVFLPCLLPLVALPTSEVIGKVVGSKGAFLGGVALPNAGTILNNDQLTTGPGGKALVQFSPTSRMTLSENTAVRFARSGTAYFGEMSSGALVAETRGAGDLVIQTPKYKVEPVDGITTICLVAMMADRSTVVAAKDGRVAITEISSGLKYVLPGGEYAQIPPDALGVPTGRGNRAPQAGQPAPGTTSAPWHIGSLSHGASVGLVVALAAGTAAAIAIPLAVSGGAVSPSTP